MTTFDKDGRMRSGFFPPTDETGRVLTHAEYIKQKALRLLADRSKEEVLEFLEKYREAGPKDSQNFINAMNAAVEAVQLEGASQTEGKKDG